MQGKRRALIGPAMVLCALRLIAGDSASADTILHTFHVSDGAFPTDPTFVGPNLLVGGTESGGASNRGAIYAMNKDGSGYHLLHSFTGAPDGWGPGAALALSGSTLYGTTKYGGIISDGSGGNGTIFSINTDGSNYQVLHDMTGLGATADGTEPRGLTVSGSTIYGTARLGGSGSRGTVFAMNTDGSNFHVLHYFGSGESFGSSSTLVLSGSKLYGTTNQGGPGAFGDLYSLNTDGSNFQILHSFTGLPGDTRQPGENLTLVGGTLYGASYGDGLSSSNLGAVFSVKTDGSEFQLLHTFAGGPGDGARSAGGLLSVGSTLIGTTQNGGLAVNRGTVFTMNTDGTNFHLLDSFARGPNDGQAPGRLTLAGELLYGTTTNGGATGVGGNDGIIFSVQVPEPSSLALAAAGLFGLAAWTSTRRRRARCC